MAAFAAEEGVGGTSKSGSEQQQQQPTSTTTTSSSSSSRSDHLDLNLKSALAHILVDSMRTLTCLICSVLLWEKHNDADSYGAMIVSGLTFVMVGFLVVELINEVARGRRSNEPPEKHDAEQMQGAYLRQ